MFGHPVRVNLGLAAGLALAALLVDPYWVARWWSSDGELTTATRGLLRAMQLGFAAGAVVFVRLRHRIDPALLAGLALCLLVGGGLSEAVLAAAIRTPWLDGLAPLRAAARQIYLEDRSYVQYREDCALYDVELAYRLRPGSCPFETAEFRTRLEVNHLGLRDDEASLEAPEVIVLGDSFAMGWGVEQDESFPEIAEAQTGLRVLNAGVSSYGTARELLMLERLDRSHLKLLVIQHCTGNDFVENLAFVQEGGRLPVMSAAAYAELVASRGGARGYFPGRHLWSAFRSRLLSPALARAQAGLEDSDERSASSEDELPAPMDPREQARLFLEVLELSPVDLEGVPILVFDLGAPDARADGFVTALSEASRKGDRAGALEVLPLARELEAQHYFRLDEHINRAGHRRVGELLAERVRRLARPTARIY